MKDIDGDGFITEQDMTSIYDLACGPDEELAEESERMSAAEVAVVVVVLVW